MLAESKILIDMLILHVGGPAPSGVEPDHYKFDLSFSKRHLIIFSVCILRWIQLIRWYSVMEIHIPREEPNFSSLLYNWKFNSIFLISILKLAVFYI